MEAAEVDRDFEDFYRANYQRVVNNVRNIVGVHAEDAAQEAFIVARQRWHEVVSLDVPHAWVRKVALRIAHRHGARDHRRALLEASRLPQRTWVSTCDPDLVTALASLPVRQATAVRMHYVDDRPVSDVAVELGCSDSAAKVLLLRARRELGERLIGFSGQWTSEILWTPAAIAKHLRHSAEAQHVHVVVDQDLGGRGGRWELSLAHATYTLFRDDGLRLDLGTYRLIGRDTLELTPALAPGRVQMRWSIDANQLQLRFVDSTCPPHLGVPDRVFWSLYADSGPFAYAGLDAARRG